MVHTKITDLCKLNNDVHPNPVYVWVPGIAFNKETAYTYFGGDATINCAPIHQPRIIDMGGDTKQWPVYKLLL